jgi:hypothetical protein
MQETSLEFKGLKKGLYAVYKGTGGFEDFIGALEAKLNSSGDFFTGAYVAGVYLGALICLGALNKNVNCAICSN